VGAHPLGQGEIDLMKDGKKLLPLEDFLLAYLLPDA
jgi:hypothetical protein